MTHEPDTSRPLPGVTPDYSKKWTDFSFDYLKEDSGVTPEQRLWDRARNGEFCSDKCPQDCLSNQLQALAEVVRAAREVDRTVAGSLLHDLHAAIERLDSQEEQQS